MKGGEKVEIKLAGFQENIDQIGGKKSLENQDELSQLFSMLLLNIMPVVGNQQGELVDGKILENSGEVIDISKGLSIEFKNEIPEALVSPVDLSKLVSDFNNISKSDKKLQADFSDIKELQEVVNDLLGKTDNKSMSMLNSIINSIENTPKGESPKSLEDLLPGFKDLPEKLQNIVSPIPNEEEFSKSFNEELEIPKSIEIDEKKLDKTTVEDNGKTVKDSFPNILNEVITEKQTATQGVKPRELGNELSKVISNPQDLVEVAVEKFRSLKLPDRTELRVKLRPEELGDVTVKLVLEKGQINGSIYVENKDVVNMLKSQMDYLKQELKTNNINLNSLSVNLSGDNSFEKGSSRQEFSQNNRGRRSVESYEEYSIEKEDDGINIIA